MSAIWLFHGVMTIISCRSPTITISLQWRSWPGGPGVRTPSEPPGIINLNRAKPMGIFGG